MELKTLGKKVKSLTDGGEDRGVSPVIGVILMVAITVILAAVIGAFVLGLGDNIETNAQAGASVTDSPNEGTLTATYTSNQNADYLTISINGEQAYINDDGSTVLIADKATADAHATADAELFTFENPGDSQTFEASNFNVDASSGSVEYGVVVTAHINEGPSSVIVDTSATAAEGSTA